MTRIPQGNRASPATASTPWSVAGRMGVTRRTWRLSGCERCGEVIDVFELREEGRPEISILSDDFLDQITTSLAGQPELGVALLKKILSDEIRVRAETNRMQAKLFSDKLEVALARYEARQLTSAQIIERLVEVAQELRGARHRHEALGLTMEEVAFYDALAGSSEDWVADAKLAHIARALVAGIKADLSVDWADHESTEAAIRTKIKHLLRRHGYDLPIHSGGRGVQLNQAASLVLDQARELYRFWPELAYSESF